MANVEKPSFLTRELSVADSALLLAYFCEGLPEKCGDALPLVNAWKAEKRTPIMMFKLHKYMRDTKIYSFEYLENNWSKYSHSFGSWQRFNGFSDYGQRDEKSIKRVLDLLDIKERV